MVDVSKIKSRLGSPPESGAVKGNLRQPEEVPVITDGRSLRATARTAQLSTRIKPETVHLLRSWPRGIGSRWRRSLKGA
jgi:hypothetical protein